MLNSLPSRQAGVFVVLYLEKIPVLVFQKELIEVPLSITEIINVSRLNSITKFKQSDTFNCYSVQTNYNKMTIHPF